jgi:hypothetical protein
MEIGVLSLARAMLETLERFGTHIAKGGNRFQLSSLVPTSYRFLTSIALDSET